MKGIGEPLFARKLSDKERARIRAMSQSKGSTKRTGICGAQAVCRNKASKMVDKLHPDRHTVRLWIGVQP